MTPPDTLRWPCRELPRIKTAGRYPLDARDFRRSYISTTHAVHLHEYSGRLRRNENDEVKLQPGDLTLSPAGEVSSYALDEPGHHLCIHFDPLPASRTSCWLPCYLSLGPRQSHIAQRMRHIIDLHAQAKARGTRGRTAAAAASAALQALLLEVGLGDSPAKATGRRRYSDAAVRRVAELLHERYDQRIMVQGLASEVDLSQSYLARQFHRHYGITINSFLRQRRIGVAVQLLRTTDLPIKAIAGRVGIPDLPHFHRQFRAETGTTPGRVQRDLTQN